MRKNRKLKNRLEYNHNVNPFSLTSSKIKEQIAEIKGTLNNRQLVKLKRKKEKQFPKPRSNQNISIHVLKICQDKGKHSATNTENGSSITDRKAVTNLLQTQFQSAFSNPNNPGKVPSSSNQTPVNTLSDFSFDKNDIVQAIEEIDGNSFCPDNCIPAMILKKCKTALAKPLFILWKESFKKSISVPKLHKKNNY